MDGALQKLRYDLAFPRMLQETEEGTHNIWRPKSWTIIHEESESSWFRWQQLRTDKILLYIIQVYSFTFAEYVLKEM